MDDNEQNNFSKVSSDCDYSATQSPHGTLNSDGEPSGRLEFATPDKALWAPKVDLMATPPIPGNAGSGTTIPCSYPGVMWNSTGFKVRLPSCTMCGWGSRETDKKVELLKVENVSDPVSLVPGCPSCGYQESTVSVTLKKKNKTGCFVDVSVESSSGDTGSLYIWIGEGDISGAKTIRRIPGRDEYFRL